MKRGPIIHGVLLLAALLFAYQTWTREEKVEPKTGDVKVWRLPAGSITSVVYDGRLRTVLMEKRTEGDETYWWGTETTSTTKKVKRPDLPPDPDGKEQTEDEVTTKVRQFAIGEKGDEVIEHLTSLNALREISDLSDEKLQEYGLNDSVENLTVNHQGGSKNLSIGGKVFSGSDRFVRDTETGKAYAIAGQVITALTNGQGGLQLRNYHSFDDETIAGVAIHAGEQTRELVRITVDADDHAGAKARKAWADVRTPDKPDVTMANFLTRAKALNALSYESESKPEDMVLLVRIDYKSENGKDAGWLEFYEKTVEVTPAPVIDPKMLPTLVPTETERKSAGEAKEQAGDSEKPATAEDGATAEGDAPAEEQPPEPVQSTAYYMRTERTRSLALVSKDNAARLAEDINQIFSAN